MIYLVNHHSSVMTTKGFWLLSRKKPWFIDKSWLTTKPPKKERKKKRKRTSVWWIACRVGGGVVNSDFSKSCVGHKHKHKHKNSPIVVLKQCTTAKHDLDTIYIACDLKEIGHDQNLISFNLGVERKYWLEFL